MARTYLINPDTGSVNEVTIAVVLDGMDLTDTQWAVLEPIFRPRRRPDGRGRPWTDPRGVLNGVLWVLRTGAPWARSAATLSAVSNLSSPLSAVATLRPPRSVAATPRRGSARPRQNRSQSKPSSTPPSPRRKKGRCGRSDSPRQRHQDHGDLSTVMVFLSPCTWPALHRMSRTSSPPPSTPASSPSSRTRLIGDRGYDSDPLDALLRERYGIEMIAAHRRGRRAPTQDGRPLRRHRRRWKIERFFAWLHNSRRARHPLGIPRRELPRDAAARLRTHPAQAFMRCLLVLCLLTRRHGCEAPQL